MIRRASSLETATGYASPYSPTCAPPPYDACSIPATRVLAILYALRDEGEVLLTVGHLHDDNQLCQCPDDIGARLVSEWQLDDSN